MILTNLAPLLNAFDHLVGLYKGDFTFIILKKEKEFIKTVFLRFERALDHSSVCGIGLGCIMNFKLCNTQVYYIPFFLDYCISVFVLARSVVCS